MRNADAVLRLSVSANPAVYEEIRRDPEMCEALRELMKDDIQKAEQEGADEATVTLIKNQMGILGWDAATTMNNLGISAADQARYAAML